MIPVGNMVNHGYEGRVLLAQRPPGKAMAGLIDYARAGKLKETGPVVFLHTGGTPALFVYPGIADS